MFETDNPLSQEPGLAQYNPTSTARSVLRPPPLPAFGLLFGLFLGAACLLSCAGQESHRDAATSSPPNVLFIVWDTVRADRLGLYGYPEDTTPGIDRFFAQDGRIYDRAISAAPWTVPSHAAMFTGLFPTTTGATHDHKWLDDRFDTLAEHLGARGFATYLNSANPNVSAETNLSQGFDQLAHPWLNGERHGPEDPEELPARISNRLFRKQSSQQIVNTFLGWVKARPDKQPFFAYLNFMEAHWPRRLSEEKLAQLTPPERKTYRRLLRNRQPLRMAFNFNCHQYLPAELQMMNRVYDDSLRQLDRSTSFLLQQLNESKFLDNTLVIFTSDHGENLGDHHLLGHEFSVHESLLHVPLAIRFPPRFPPGRSAAPVQTSDIFRTVLEATDTRVTPVEGEESYSLLDGEGLVPRRRPLVSEYLAPKQRVRSLLDRQNCEEPRFEVLRAFELGGVKAIWSHLGRRELYRPESDPGELIDLSTSEPKTLETLMEAMNRWVESRPASQAIDLPTPSTKEARERLKALGYL